MSRRRGQRPRGPTIEVITWVRGSRCRNVRVFHDATCTIGEQFTRVQHRGGDNVFANAIIDEIRQDNDG